MCVCVCVCVCEGVRRGGVSAGYQGWLIGESRTHFIIMIGWW